MHVTLDDIALRVLAVLMEKSLAQQAIYPMTINAILLGANQKQNREPVMDLSEGEVAAAIHRLEGKGLVGQATPDSGARVNRFEHKVVNRLGWDRKVQAMMAELMLRGPQTLGELRARAGRMTSFVDLRAVGELLRELMSQDPPVVEELPREPGRSANRYRHLVGGAEEPVEAVVETADRGGAADDRLATLESMVAQLMLRVHVLEERLAGSTDRSGDDEQ